MDYNSNPIFITDIGFRLLQANYISDINFRLTFPFAKIDLIWIQIYQIPHNDIWVPFIDPGFPLAIINWSHKGYFELDYLCLIFLVI